MPPAIPASSTRPGRWSASWSTVADPRLGETVLDPACGTGGFLVEAFEHLEKQCKTVEDLQRPAGDELFGGEAKSLPYLLAQMNLLLHGLESPQIDLRQQPSISSREIGDKDRVDVIMTNPPFGGEEEARHPGQLPRRQADGRDGAAVPATHHAQAAAAAGGSKPGRAGVVVPNGMLFGDGVCARIKEELLKEFNLHTIVRLPNGVFAPYTSIPTNLLFFDRSGPTKEIWYYEQPLPEGRKNYTKTQPLQFEEFAPCLEWWNKREANERAWKVQAERCAEIRRKRRSGFREPRHQEPQRQAGFRAPAARAVGRRHP